MVNKAITTVKKGKIKTISLKTGLTAALLLLSLILILLIWQLENQSQANRIIGSWYCIENGQQYVFDSDGKFYNRSGLRVIEQGSWRPGWQRQTLVFKIQIDNKSETWRTLYQFSNDDLILEIIVRDSQQLTLSRLQSR